jgi:hypothetical protein
MPLEKATVGMKHQNSWMRWVVAICLMIGIPASMAGLMFYFDEYPPDFHCRSEFKRATGIELPAEAQLIASCSASAFSTAAVYEIDSQHWPELLQSVSRVGKPGRSLPDEECEPSIRPLLKGPEDTHVVVMVNHDQVTWSTNSATKRIYWQVTVD